MLESLPHFTDEKTVLERLKQLVLCYTWARVSGRVGCDTAKTKALHTLQYLITVMFSRVKRIAIKCHIHFISSAQHNAYNHLTHLLNVLCT